MSPPSLVFVKYEDKMNCKTTDVICQPQFPTEAFKQYGLNVYDPWKASLDLISLYTIRTVNKLNYL